MAADPPAFRFMLRHRFTRYTLRVFRAAAFLVFAFELLRRISRYTLWVYGRSNDNPTAVCQIVIDGDGEGEIDSLLGPDFYLSLPRGGLDKFRETGATVFRADVRRTHLTLIQRVLHEYATVEEIGPSKAGSVELIRIKIVLPPLAADPTTTASADS